MRIALISFEYPPDTAVGGIATYVGQFAEMMSSRGHDVEVFCGSFTRTECVNEGNIKVHRIRSERTEFPALVTPIFEERNRFKEFQIMECPEYGADAIIIKKRNPRIPLTVKLHTPKYLINKLNNVGPAPGLISKGRFILGAIRRGRAPKCYWKYYKEDDPEYELALMADLITSPSVSLREIVSKDWKLYPDNIKILPYPFVPKPALLQIPAKTDCRTVLYFGRLEIRKGVDKFANTIPEILKRYPGYKIIFAGKSLPSDIPGVTMREFLKKELSNYLDSIQFLDHVPQDEIPNLLSQSDICVFPSLWENFPNVCLEAMSAARGIVASKNGGMKDMLEDIKGGILINPFSSNEIFKGIEYLIENKEEREKMGLRSRNKIKNIYNRNNIGSLTEDFYSAITV